MLRIAVTRAAPESFATAARISALGAEPILAPLLVIEPRAFDSSLDNVQALLFTSANGVRAFPAAAPSSVRVLAVGEATAAQARAAGFANVRAAEGDVAALARLAQAELDPSAGALVHVSGADIAGDLAQTLRTVGFRVERRIAYQAHAVETPPAAFAGPLDMVLFHSARAAETFVRLGAPGAERLAAACLSPAVAAAVAAATWARIIIAPAPQEDVLLKAALRDKSAPSGASA